MADETNIPCARLRKKIENTPKPNSAKLVRDNELEGSLIYFCQLGRLAAGHEVNVVWNDPPKSGRIKQVKVQEAHSAMRMYNGNILKAAKYLGVSRATLYTWLQCVLLITGLVVVMGCKTTVQTFQPAKPEARLAVAIPPPPQDVQRSALPAFPALRVALVAPADTNGMIHLEWNSGNPPETIIENLTTGKTLDCGTNTNATIKGLAPGSLNVIIARNSFAASEQLAATAITNWPGVFPVANDYTFKVFWTNGVLQFTTNLIGWLTYAGTSPALVTNKGTFFFRSRTADTNAIREAVRIDPYQVELVWRVVAGKSQRLQLCVDPVTESFQDVLYFSATNTGSFSHITAKRGRYRVLQ